MNRNSISKDRCKMAQKCVSRSVDCLTYVYVRYGRSYSRKASGIHFTPVFTKKSESWP